MIALKKKNKLLCACGCTQEVPDKWSYKAKRPVIFIRGHNVRGKKLSKGALKKLRVIWNSAEYKMKKRSERLGRKLSKETIAKLLGHPVTQETRRKISEANKRHWNDEKTGARLRRNMSKVWKGKKFTEEHKRNLSLSKIRDFNSKKKEKGIIIVTPEGRN